MSSDNDSGEWFLAGLLLGRLWRQDAPAPRQIDAATRERLAPRWTAVREFQDRTRGLLAIRTSIVVLKLAGMAVLTFVCAWFVSLVALVVMITGEDDTFPVGQLAVLAAAAIAILVVFRAWRAHVRTLISLSAWERGWAHKHGDAGWHAHPHAAWHTHANGDLADWTIYRNGTAELNPLTER